MPGRDAARPTERGKPLSARAAAEELGCSPDTVNALAEAGELEGCWRVGKRGDLRVPRQAVEDYIRQHLVGA